MSSWNDLIKCLLITITPYLIMFAIDKSIKRDKTIIITEDEVEETVKLFRTLEKDVI